MENARAPYRNAIRSRELIRSAFLQLMQETDVTKIKAKDVIESASISKGTFYAHYNSVFDVYEDIEKEYLDLMFKVFKDPLTPITFENLMPLFLNALDEIEKQRDTFRILFCCNYREQFWGKVKERFLECMLENCAHDCRFQDKDRMLGFFTFAVGGALTLTCDWIDAKERVASDACAYFINDCITNGINIILAPVK